MDHIEHRCLVSATYLLSSPPINSLEMLGRQGVGGRGSFMTVAADRSAPPFPAHTPSRGRRCRPQVTPFPAAYVHLFDVVHIFDAAASVSAAIDLGVACVSTRASPTVLPCPCLFLSMRRVRPTWFVARVAMAGTPFIAAEPVVVVVLSRRRTALGALESVAKTPAMRQRSRQTATATERKHERATCGC